MNERFWSKVNVRGPMLSPYLGPCWIWTAGRTTKGYGVVHNPGGTRQAHRFAYELFAGPISPDLHTDHLCRKCLCVNPAHLEPVTELENIQRGDAGRVARERQLAKTHCPHGHPYDEANTRWYKDERRCRECARLRSRRRRAAASARSRAALVPSPDDRGGERDP